MKIMMCNNTSSWRWLSIISFLLHAIIILLVVVDASSSSSSSWSEECQCKVQDRPDKSEKALTARWMVHSLDWGVLSTISSRLPSSDGGGEQQNNGKIPIPFGNIYSYVDGTCHKSTGIIYLYGTYMDQSFADSLHNSMVSFTLSEASLSSVCTERDGIDACTLGTKWGDPENPVCARLTLTGSFEALEEDSEEYDFAKAAMFERHSTMEGWPSDHEWVLAKIDIQDIWLIDFFGGATILSPEEYFAATPDIDTL